MNAHYWNAMFVFAVFALALTGLFTVVDVVARGLSSFRDRLRRKRS